MGSSIKILSDIYKCSSCFRLYLTKGRKRERLINLKDFIINTGRILLFVTTCFIGVLTAVQFRLKSRKITVSQMTSTINKHKQGNSCI